MTLPLSVIRLYWPARCVTIVVSSHGCSAACRWDRQEGIYVPVASCAPALGARYVWLCVIVVGIALVVGVLENVLGTPSLATTAQPPAAEATTGLEGPSLPTPTAYAQATPTPPLAARSSVAAGGSVTATQTDVLLPTPVLQLSETPSATLTGDAAQRNGAANILLQIVDLPPSFAFQLGSPQVDIGTGGQWDGFEQVAAQPEVASGLNMIVVDLLHTTSPTAARHRLAATVQEAMYEDGDGVHRSFHSYDKLPGVQYLRLIINQGGYWYATYDAIFAVGKYANKVMALAYINGPEDHAFGVVGLNQYVSLLMQREQDNP